MRLSDRIHWDNIYQQKRLIARKSSGRGNGKDLLKSILPEKLASYMNSYDQYLLWDVIYPRFMPRKKARVLEVGSAPGTYLVKLSKKYKFEPYGVEYSQSGALLNKEIFISNRINPDNVIHADFFSKDFHDAYKAYFDIVVSRGFIEHFTDVEYVIGKHIDLLRKGGRVFVTIPNYCGVNYILQWLFNKDAITMHNLGIMTKERFSRIFDNRSLKTLHCDYWGTFNFNVFSYRSSLKSIQSACERFQLMLNITFRTLFRSKEPRSRFTSPHLMYIGEKISEN